MESEPFLLPSGSLNGDDTAGPREESSQMQVIESDTARADAAALATPTTADATKSGDVETDDDMSVEAADDGADSNYQPSDDDNDNSGIKKKEVYKREGGAATLKRKFRRDPRSVPLLSTTLFSFAFVQQQLLIYISLLQTRRKSKRIPPLTS